MTRSRYEELAAAAEWARVVLDRVGGEGGVVEQIAEGAWDGNLIETSARDLADTLCAVAEHARGARALAGGLANETRLPTCERD